MSPLGVMLPIFAVSNPEISNQWFRRYFTRPNDPDAALLEELRFQIWSNWE